MQQPESDNAGLLFRAIYLNEWATIPEIWDFGNEENMRNFVINKLNERLAEDVGALQQQDNAALAYSALLTRFLLQAGARDENALHGMTSDDCRNETINCTTSNTGRSVPELQGMNNLQLLQVAYSYLIPQLYADTINKIRNARDGGSVPPCFHNHDNHGKGLDCLNVLNTTDAEEGDFKYLGISHHPAENDNCFVLNLSGSHDLQNWTLIRPFKKRQHQGEMARMGEGFVVVNEEDPNEGQNNVRVRFYRNRADLYSDVVSHEMVCPRSLTQTCEGTPDIREIHGTDPENCTIFLGFHYYSQDYSPPVDQQAFGILKNFKEWRAYRDVIVNHNSKALGYGGNIGGRSAFISPKTGRKCVVIECQTDIGNWGGWHMMIGDGAFYSRVEVDTPRGARSFANPKVSVVDNNELCVTAFMHGCKENPCEEGGTLIYSVRDH